MKKLKASVIFASMILVLIALASCSVEKAYPGAPDGMRPLNEGDEGAIIYVPSSWSVETSTGIPTGYYSAKDRSMITLMTVTPDKLNGTTAPEYWESYKETFSSSLKDFQIVKSEDAQKDYITRIIADAPAYIYDFTATISGLEYKFRQAVFINSSTGNLYIITYSSSIETFDSHTETLKEVYENFKFVTEPIPMIEKSPAVVSEEIQVPENMKLVSGTYVDYYLFVPKSWEIAVQTGMSGAYVSQDNKTMVSVTAFNTDISEIDKYWENYKEELNSAFGEDNCVFYDGYTEVDLDGYNAKKYYFDVNMGENTMKYSQVYYLKGGYAYIITLSGSPEKFENHNEDFENILNNFKFK